MSYTLYYPQQAEALYEALKGDAFYHKLEASLPSNSAREKMLAYLDYSMTEAEKYGELFISTEKTYGASVWSKPLTSEKKSVLKTAKRNFLKKHLGDNSLEVYDAIVKSMSSTTSQCVGDDFWYLSILGLSPKFQGQGLGSFFLQEALEEMDRRQVSSYLETFTPRNRSFYEKFDYREVASFLEPVTHAKYWVMTRTPR